VVVLLLLPVTVLRLLGSRGSQMSGDWLLDGASSPHVREEEEEEEEEEEV